MKKFFKLLFLTTPFLFIGILLIILFWKVFFQGFVFIDGDNFHLNIPMKYLLVDSIKNKFFPFWNPYILGGIPYAADLNLGTFNPLNIFYFFFSVPRALTLQVIADLFFIGCFMYIYMNQKVRKRVALFGAIVFMLSGTVFTFTTNVTILNTIVYIPLVFYFVEKFFQTNKKKYMILLVIAESLQIISGHPQITYYTGLFICFFILFQTNCTLKKRLIFTLFYGLFSLLISSFQLIPFFEYVMHAHRPIGSLFYASSGSLTFSNLVTMFFPTFFGTKLVGDWWGSQVMLFGYIGVIPVLFMFIGIFFARFTNRTYYFLAFTLSFLLAFGKSGGLFFLFYYFVPGWSAFRSPSDILVLTTFFSTIFISFGLEFALRNTKNFSNFGKRIFLTSLSFLILLLTIVIISTKFALCKNIIIFLSSFQTPLVNKILFYDFTKIQSILTEIIVNISIFFVLLLIAGVLFWKVLQYTRIVLISLILLTASTLLIFNSTYLELAPLSFYSIKPITLPSDLQNGEYRLFAQPVIIEQDRRFLPGPKFFYVESTLNLAELTDDHVITFRAQAVTGYTSLVLKNYQQFIGGNNITGIDVHRLTSKKLDMLSAKYSLSLSKNNTVKITKNISALPRMRFSKFYSKNEIGIKLNTPNKIILSVNTNEPNVLILADNYYPGWSAKVNGKIIQVSVYHNVFRQITVPKGKSTIIFIYDPLSWKIGVMISVIGLFCLFVVIKNKKQYA